MLQEITPMILTFNEERNIGRTLSMLGWAKDIVVVDSGSSDGTVDILNQHPNVRVYTREFDVLARQWQYGLDETEIQTEWVLALDADYLLSSNLVDELRDLEPADNVSGFRTRFEYCIDGRRIRGSLYPPVAVLYRKKSAHYMQQGHAQRVQIAGEIEELKSIIYHDDRKPFRHWIRSQVKYASQERDLVRSASWRDLSMTNKLRKLIVITPILAPLYVLFVRGALLSGIPGIKYAGQRLIAESMMSYQLLFK